MYYRCVFERFLKSASGETGATKPSKTSRVFGLDYKTIRKETERTSYGEEEGSVVVEDDADIVVFSPDWPHKSHTEWVRKGSAIDFLVRTARVPYRHIRVIDGVNSRELYVDWTQGLTGIHARHFKSVSKGTETTD